MHKERRTLTKDAHLGPDSELIEVCGRRAIDFSASELGPECSAAW